MIGNTTRDSRLRAWKPVLSATTRHRSRPIASQSQAIFGERSAQRHERPFRVLIEREEVGVMLSQQACDVVG